MRSLEMPVTSFEKLISFCCPMKQRTQPDNTAKAQRWARRLSLRVKKVLADHPHADPDNVRHTLILLEQPPLERLQRSLTRGRETRLQPLAHERVRIFGAREAQAARRNAVAITPTSSGRVATQISR